MKLLQTGILLLIFALQLPAAEDSFTVLAVSDTHAAENWQQLAPLILEERERAGKNVLLADAGDTLYGHFPGSVRQGELPLEILNFLRFDVWVPGNHDFEQMPYRFSEFHGTVLSCDWRTRDFTPKAWKMFHLANRKIAVIGLGESRLRQRLPAEKQVTHVPADKALDNAVAEAQRAGAEFLILIRHDGLYSGSGSLYRLLQRHPEIGLVILAHTHEEIAGKRVAGAWVVQGGSHARALAVIRVSFCKDTKTPVMTSVLLYPDPQKRMAWPPKIAALFREVRQTGDQILGTVPGGLHAPDCRDFRGTFGDLVEQALRDATGAELACCIVRQGDFTASEKITKKALFRLLPYSSTVCCIRLTPEEIGIIVRDWIKFQQKRRNLAIRFGGMKIYRDRRGALKKLVLPPPGLDGKIPIAMTDFELTGGGSRTSPLPGWIASGMPYRNTGILLRDKAAEILSRKKP